MGDEDTGPMAGSDPTPWPERTNPGNGPCGYDAGVEPFPKAEALALIKRLPSYGRLAWQLSLDPQIPASRRGAVIGAAAYLVSPIDAVPGIIPLIGQLDDILVVIVALRFALAGMPPEQRQRHLETAGLSEAILAADEGTLADIARWTARGAVHAGALISRASVQAGARAGQRLGELGQVGLDRLRLADRSRTGLDRSRGGLARVRSRIRRHPDEPA